MTKNNEEKKPLLQQMYEIVLADSKVYKDQSNTYYCLPNGTSIAMPLDGEEFLNYCVNLCRTKNAIYPKRDDVRNVLPYLKDEKQTINLPYYISKRCAYDNDNVYIDLANTSNEILKIADGRIQILNKTEKPFFKRSSTMLPLPCPDFDSQPSDLLPLLKKHFVINDEQMILLSVWLVLSFISDIQIPLIMINGSKGSSKSTLSKRIRCILDNSIDKTVMLPSNERDMGVLLDNHFLIIFDNVSDGDIKSRLSDMISVSITKGTSYSVRTLYSNNSVTSLHLNNRIVLNGISNTLLKKSDALDRTIVLKLERIPINQMKSVQELDKAFDKDITSIFGSICNTLSQVLSKVDQVEVDSISRMNDFTRYGYCVADILGIGGDTFIDVYKRNITSVNDLLIEEDVIASIIFEIMQDKKKLALSVSELYQRVKEVAEASKISSRELPGSPSHFSSKLLELQSNLREHGLSITKKNNGRYKEVTLEWMDD